MNWWDFHYHAFYCSLRNALWGVESGLIKNLIRFCPILHYNGIHLCTLPVRSMQLSCSSFAQQYMYNVGSQHFCKRFLSRCNLFSVRFMRNAEIEKNYNLFTITHVLWILDYYSSLMRGDYCACSEISSVTKKCVKLYKCFSINWSHS